MMGVKRFEMKSMESRRMCRHGQASVHSQRHESHIEVHQVADNNHGRKASLLHLLETSELNDEQLIHRRCSGSRSEEGVANRA